MKQEEKPKYKCKCKGCVGRILGYGFGMCGAISTDGITCTSDKRCIHKEKVCNV